jgi:trehalose 6-phosphate phosphatase
VADAAGHLGFEPHYLVGNHGAEGLPGGCLDADSFRELTAGWERQARACLARLKGQGLMIENKGVSLAVHYRNAVNRQEAREAIAACIKRLKPGPRHVTGKYVENLIPPDAPDKGRALHTLMEVSGCRKAFYIGDDETDEDVFRLGDERIFSIHVGTGGATSARFFLKRQEEVVQFIQTVIGIILEQGR